MLVSEGTFAAECYGGTQSSTNSYHGMANGIGELVPRRENGIHVEGDHGEDISGVEDIDARVGDAM
jgi:hypothetical protein